MKKNNRGVTLIELLVSIAILGIIAVGATGFLVVGSKTYNNVSYSVRLQYESQLVMNQIQKYVISCSDGIAWDSANNTLYVADAADDGGDTLYVFRFDPVSGCLYFGSGAAAATPVGADDLMAEHITGISVAFSAAGSAGRANSAAVEISMARGTKTYTGKQTIALRNQPLAASSWSDLWNVLQ